MDIRGKRIIIIGLGLSGASLAKFVLRLGGEPRISDSAPKEIIAETICAAGLESQVKWEADAHTKDFILDSDAVVISPGVRRDALPIQWAKENNIPVLGEIELAWFFCRNPIVAITGSNGKTTVSTLIHAILEKSGKKACLCGNIGSPFIGHVLDLSSEEIVVLEVSSFQLESTSTFRPHVSVLLNCTQNHLDRHNDMEEYFLAKTQIFKNQDVDDFAILNFNDEKTRNLKSQLKAKVSYFNGPHEQKSYAGENLNFLAARKVAHVFGVPDDVINKVFQDFRGVEHRLEWVRTLDKVDFINDSKATTAEAGQWALRAMQRPVVMICGGRDKNIDFSVLSEIVIEKVKFMIIIGEARKKIKKAFASLIDIEEADSLCDAVKKAKQKAEQGDCVLLSPMCTSFDMFKNFEERGKVFKEIVNQL
ncbi:MAG: Mur ligase family protein [Candidatus Aceula meridiana]|nr:Mur ligase family protein [Candidatus Aceula meridiana]